MRRWLIACLCLGLLVAAVPAADEKGKDEKKEEKKENTPLEVYKNIMTEAVKKFRAAEKDEEKQKILKATAEKLIDLAEKNSKDPIAMQALVTIVAGMPLEEKGKDTLKAKAVALLKKDHIKNENLSRIIPRLAMSDSAEIVDFLKHVIAQSTDKKTRAEAVKAVMGAAEGALANTDDPKKAEELKGEMGKFRKLISEEFKGQIKDLYVGAKMPELTSKNLDDKEVKLSDYKGKVVVVDIWATWCGPCRAMIPHSNKLVERMKDKPFALVSVSFDEKKETVTKFLEDNKMPWVHWWNGVDGSIGKELDIQFFPTIYVVDADGIIRFKNIRDKKLDKAIDTLVKEAEAKKGKS